MVQSNPKPEVEKRRGRSRLRRALGLALALLALAVALAALVVAVFGQSWLAGAIVVAPNAGRTFRSDGDPEPARYHSLGIDEQLRLEVAEPGEPPVSLSLWLIEPESEAGGAPRGTVFVLHGIRSDKFWLRGLARRVAEAGYRAVLVDLRGHGLSSGDWLSYGVREARDLRAVLDQLVARDRVRGEVGVVGLSYGAATAIEWAGLDPRVRAVVAIAPFSSLRAVVPGYVHHYLPGVGRLIPESFIQHAIDRAAALARFDAGEASPLDAIAKTRAPVLLIHGRADQHISPSASIGLHQVAADHSELVLVDHEDHFSIIGDRSGAIGTRGIAWLHRWLDHAR